MTCGKDLRAGKTCGRDADHDGQHRTARSMNRRNITKRRGNQKARLSRERAGWVDQRTVRRTIDTAEYVQSLDLEPADDDYYASKRAAGLIT